MARCLLPPLAMCDRPSLQQFGLRRHGYIPYVHYEGLSKCATATSSNTESFLIGKAMVLRYSKYLQVASIKQIQLRIHLLLVPLQKPWGNASICFSLLLHCTHIHILLDRQGVGFDAAELFHGRYLLGYELKAKTSACIVKLDCCKTVCIDICMA